MNELHEIFKALGDDTRICIVRKLAEGEKRACQIVPCDKKAQPTVSAHLKILLRAGIIDFRKAGKERIYALKNSNIVKIMKILEGE